MLQFQRRKANDTTKNVSLLCFPINANFYRLHGICSDVVRSIKERLVSVRIKEGKWYEPNGYVFDRVNFKDEVVFRRNTKETLEEVEEYLNFIDVLYISRRVDDDDKTVWIKTDRGVYSYYYPTGRWNVHLPRGYSHKNYKSNGIVDFITRFATGSLKQMYKKKEK